MKIKREQITCSSCGLIKSANITNYFKTDNPLYNEFFPTCKSCVYDLYNSYIQSGSNIRDSVIKVCELLDKPFLEEVFYNTFEKEKINPNLLGIYFKNSAMPQYRKQGLVRYKDSIFANSSSQGQQSVFEDQTRIYSEEWNGRYTQVDIKYLDKYLTGLHSDFKINTTSYKDYAKKICCASLAVNKAYQEMLDGTNGADKKYKDLQATFDTLSKSAQFTENSRSSISAGINSICQVVDKIESKDWIYVAEDYEKDAIEHLLDQFNNIQKSL
ncbi:MAG TPA: hypothetical protein VIM42_00600 [Clostridium sp.]